MHSHHMDQELSVRCLCANCGAKLRLPLSKFGSTAPCPECSRPTALTLEDQPARAFPECLTPEQVLTSFSGISLARPVMPWIYYLEGIAAVVAMSLALLGYFALLGMAICGVWGCMTTVSRLLGATDVGILFFEIKLFICVVLLGVGTLFLVLLAKPLLVGRSNSGEALELNPSFEPALYAFANRIAELVGSPALAGICVDLTLGVSVDFSGPSRKNPVLTLGLPILAALNTRELAGMICAELGMYSTATGGWHARIVSRISSWFVRAIYGRDEWDLWLVDRVETLRSPLGRQLVKAAIASISYCRRSLGGLYYLPRTCSRLLLRHQEQQANNWA
jgi:hypothetical protein